MRRTRARRHRSAAHAIHRTSCPPCPPPQATPLTMPSCRALLLALAALALAAPGVLGECLGKKSLKVVPGVLSLAQSPTRETTACISYDPSWGWSADPAGERRRRAGGSVAGRRGALPVRRRPRTPPAGYEARPARAPTPAPPPPRHCPAPHPRSLPRPHRAGGASRARPGHR